MAGSRKTGVGSQGDQVFWFIIYASCVYSTISFIDFIFLDLDFRTWNLGLGS